MSRRSPRLAALAASLALVLLPAAPGAAQEPADGAPGGTVPPAASLTTPLLSPRRVPDLLVSRVAGQRLERGLAPVLEEMPPESCFVLTEGGRPLVRINGDVPVQPASTTKLLTATAVLNRIPADRSLATVAVASSAPRGGVISGDLWVVGGGDPLLTTPGYAESFRYRDQTTHDPAGLADRIAAAGVTRIEGGVVGDESRYDTERAVPTWPSRYTRQDTVGPLSALMVNDGVLGYEDSPEAPSAERQPGEPALVAAETLTTLLEERGVEVGGEASVGTAPSGGVEVARFESLPMTDLVAEMIGFSDNTTAELLTKELGREVSGQGTTAAGLAAIRGELDALGLPTDGLTSTDGSGLDAGNRLTCDLLVAALDRAGPDSTLAEGLAVSGESGTMRPRMRSPELAGQVRAKTGTLTSPPVVSLAGFLTTVTGRTLTFAFVQNGNDADAYLQDDALTLARTYPDAPDPTALGPVPAVPVAPAGGVAQPPG